MIKAAVILADGFEEIEAISIIDVLRRGGIRVIVYGLDKEIVTGSRNIKIKCDKRMQETEEDLDAIILPGGMPGAENLARSERLRELLQKMNSNKKIVAAICASPAVVLAPLGLLEGRKATCYPGMESGLGEGVRYLEEDVVVDSNIITSRGPATAIKFSLAIVEKIVDQQTALNLKEKLLA